MLSGTASGRAAPAHGAARSTRGDATRERLLASGPSALSDAELLAVLLAGVGRRAANGGVAKGAAAALAGRATLAELAWEHPSTLAACPGVGAARGALLAAAFELGRRGAWSPPRRGERVLDPGRVAELMRLSAHADRECFHVVLLDVRGRLLRAERVAEGSLTQCPVSPRDALRPAVREGAHGVIFVHNHPSGDPSPSAEDADLTERLRAAADLVGVVARDHVIVATGGHFSFVAAGRWRR